MSSLYVFCIYWYKESREWENDDKQGRWSSYKWSNIYWANIGINLLGFLCYEIRNFVHESNSIFNRLVFYDTQTLPCIFYVELYELNKCN